MTNENVRPRPIRGSRNGAILREMIIAAKIGGGKRAAYKAVRHLCRRYQARRIWRLYITPQLRDGARIRELF